MSDVCVHGLGYIGLPTAAMLANAGHHVTGYDIDEEIVERLENGDPHIEEPGLRSFVTDAVDAGTLAFSSEPVPATYHLVCVPTPLSERDKRADLSYVESAGRTVGAHLRPGDTVVLESTVPPRTTVDALRPTLERSGLTAGADFGLAYCPETVLPGDIIAELRENDRIVGGIDETSTAAAVRLYDAFAEGEIVRAPDTTTAEFVKLLQNTFRDANIGIANEIAKLAHDYGIDSRSAIELANRHPRVNLHDPGPGVGGHCLPVDPWFLGQGSDRLSLIAKARRVNERMVDYVLERLERALSDTENRTIAVLGAAYKGNVGDTRQSPGLALADRLRSTTEAQASVADGGRPAFQNASVRVHDSHVDDHPRVRSSLDEVLSGADAAVVTTGHDEYADLDPDTVAESLAGDLVFDTTGVLDPDAWSASELRFRRL